jgi:hypothetical protein
MPKYNGSIAKGKVAQMRKHVRAFVFVLSVVLALLSIPAYILYKGLFDHIMESREVLRVTVEEVPETHPLRLRISVETGESAPIIRKVTKKQHGNTITVLYHLALAGLAKPALQWHEEYELTVPDSVREVRFGHESTLIWERSGTPVRRK